MTRGRIGIGHDIHRLVPGHALTLGGVAIPSDTGFATPSDGDVLAHALAGALAQGDMGRWFPGDADPAGPHLDAMRETLAAALAVPADRVSVKARSDDGLGPEGRDEAASATVSVLLGAA